MVAERNRLPSHGEPIYSFSVDARGRIVRKEYNQYEIVEDAGRGKGYFRVRTGPGTVSRSLDQMDRYSHGYLWSLDGDVRKAREAIRAVLLDKYERAKADMEEAGAVLEKIHMSKCVDGEDFHA